MKKRSAAVAIAATLAVAIAAVAFADNYPVRDGLGNQQTFASRLVGGIQYPVHLLFGLSSGTPTPVAMDGSGNIGVNVLSAPAPAGAATSANQATEITSLGNITTLLSAPLAVTFPVGTTPVSIQVPNNTTSVSVCASACTLYAIYVQTISATPLWVKLYNTVQGSTTCGSGTPVDRVLIPANANGAGAVVPIGGPLGARYATALSGCVTTGFADSNTGAPAANLTQISYYVK